MKYRNLLPAALLLAAVSAPALAAPLPLNGDVLHSNPGFNKNLGPDNYNFGGQHGRLGSRFQDSWKFTVAQNTFAAISLDDVEVSLKNSNKQRMPISTTKVFDSENLTLSLYNEKGRLLGRVGDDSTLNKHLLGGKWFTITVSGRVNGFFGSSYHGVLDCSPTPVPLGDTAPMLGSALALLALRYRKRLANKVRG